jgi:predicted DCC family thiol-disulfide oxidoreductase YuxK
VVSFELASALVDGDWYGPPPLTVLYDERCPLCRRLRAWLAGQATLVPIEYLPAGSALARQRYPHLDHKRTMEVLTLVTSGGAVYEGERAWLTCAWALPAWQPLAERMGGRAQLRLLRMVTKAVDHHRRRSLGSTYGPMCESCRIAAPTGP